MLTPFRDLHNSSDDTRDEFNIVIYIYIYIYIYHSLKIISSLKTSHNMLTSVDEKSNFNCLFIGKYIC